MVKYGQNLIFMSIKIILFLKVLEMEVMIKEVKIIIEASELSGGSLGKWKGILLHLGMEAF